jgi:hypothetical protein
MPKLSIADMHEVAAAKRGRFLSNEYKGAKEKHDWSCEFGHEFTMTPSDVKCGHWCQKCRNKNEQVCREIFERLTGKPFSSTRSLPWMEGLELDGFNDELKLGFEYQGKQHYVYMPHFHRNGPADLQAQQQRDQRKVVLCMTNGVRLCVIPYTLKNEFELEAFIKAFLA